MGPPLCSSNEQRQTFQELATKAHDMKVIIANCRGSSFSVAESKKEKG